MAEKRCFSTVYIINLRRRADRWTFMTEQLARAGLGGECVQRVEAVEGAAADVRALERHGVLSPLAAHRLLHSAHPVWGMDLTPGAVGCALSHVRLWAAVAAAAAEPRALPALVLEDDARLPEDLCARYTALLPRVPPDWQLLYLGGLDTAGQCGALRVASDVCRVPQFHRTTSAYAVTPAGAQRLLATCLPLTFQVDTMMTMRVEGAPVPHVRDPVCYTVQPPLVTQAEQLGTDIQSEEQR